MDITTKERLKFFFDEGDISVEDVSTFPKCTRFLHENNGVFVEKTSYK